MAEHIGTHFRPMQTLVVVFVLLFWAGCNDEKKPFPQKPLAAAPTAPKVQKPVVPWFEGEWTGTGSLEKLPDVGAVDRLARSTRKKKKPLLVESPEEVELLVQLFVNEKKEVTGEALLANQKVSLSGLLDDGKLRVRLSSAHWGGVLMGLRKDDALGAKVHLSRITALEGVVDQSAFVGAIVLQKLPLLPPHGALGSGPR